MGWPHNVLPTGARYYAETNPIAKDRSTKALLLVSVPAMDLEKADSVQNIPTKIAALGGMIDIQSLTDGLPSIENSPIESRKGSAQHAWPLEHRSPTQLMLNIDHYPACGIDVSAAGSRQFSPLAKSMSPRAKPASSPGIECRLCCM